MNPSDHQLIQQILARDEGAFETFFARYRSAVHYRVNNIVRNATAADDLVQEVFLRVWTRAEQWVGRGEVKAWLFRIATNLSLNHLRSARRRPQQPLEPTIDDWSTEEESIVPSWMIDSNALQPHAVVEGAEKQRQFWQLVDGLPEDKREVFRMVYDAEMDLRSVADKLGIPGGTVKSRLYYSKKRLAQEWVE